MLFAHLLSFLISHSSFSYCFVWALHISWPHLYSMYLFFYAIFLLYIALALSYLSLLSFLYLHLHFHCLLSLLFLYLSLMHTFSLASLLCHSSYVASTSTFSWAVHKGQLVGCNHLVHIQRGAVLQLLQTLKPLQSSRYCLAPRKERTST